MSYADAINLLDRRRQGADMPDEVVQKALELTGDLTPEPTWAELLAESAVAA